MEIIKKINDLKKKRNAIILAHNYQLPEIQEIADFSGDSLELSQKAKESNCEVIVFCGVDFMAETASILCPEKVILLPDINARCPMAEAINAEEVKKLKDKHPDATVVAYVNTYADVKAESDVCCTSANAVEVIRSIDNEKVIFLPDKYLGDYVAKLTNKNIISSHSYCHVHIKISEEHIIKLKEEHPEAKVVVHPECKPEVINLADKVASTSGMIKYCKESQDREFIIATETGLIYRLEKECKGKKFYPACETSICPNMKLIILEKVLFALEKMNYIIKVPDEIAQRARKSIEKMYEYAK